MVAINNAKLEKIKQLCRDFAKGSSDFQGNEKLYVTLGIQGKEVYLAHDGSWFQRGKNGFAITNSGIYCCNFSSSKTHVPFWKLAKAVDICIQKPELFADGNRIAYFSGFKSTRQDLKELFGKIAAAYRWVVLPIRLCRR